VVAVVGTSPLVAHFLSCGGKWEDAAHEWMFAVRAYRQAARRVYQPATLR